MEYNDDHKLKRILYNIKDSVHFVYILFGLILLIITTLKCSREESVEDVRPYDFAYITGVNDKDDYEYLKIPNYEDTVWTMSFIPKSEGVDEYSFPIPFVIINNDEKSNADLIFEIKADKRICYNTNSKNYMMVVPRISDVGDFYSDTLFTTSVTHIRKNELHNNSYISLGKSFLYTDENTYHYSKYNSVGLIFLDTCICSISDTLNSFNLTIKNFLYLYKDKNDLENNIKFLMNSLNLTKNLRNPLYLYEYSELYEASVEDYLYKYNHKRILNCKLDSIYTYDIEKKRLFASGDYNFNTMQKTNKISKFILPYFYVLTAIFLVLLSLRFILILLYKKKHPKEKLSAIYGKFFNDIAYRVYVSFYIAILLLGSLYFLYLEFLS